MTGTQAKPGDAKSAIEARTREELVYALDGDGARVKWLMFWGHRPEASGAIGKGCLSQWWPCRFVVEGVEYASAEHWMMAGKAMLFGDSDALGRILEARTPAEAKALGRTVRGFEEAAWEAARFELVVAGNVAKFGQDAGMLEFLLATRGRVLVEASPRDRVWGIGLSSHHEDATSPAKWRGLNLLGFALMEARERLART